MKRTLTLLFALALAPLANAAPIVLSFGPGSNSNSLVAFTADNSQQITYNLLERDTLANLSDITGATTAISATSGTPFVNFGHGGGTAGVSAPVSAIFPVDATTSSYWWFGAYTITFSGLDDNTAYTFDILGTITDDNQQNNTTNYAIGAQSADQDVVANANQLVTFTNVAPTGGVVTLTVTPVTGLSFLNAVQISTSNVPEPASIALFAVAGLMLVRRRK